MSRVIALVSSIFVACGGNSMGTPDALPDISFIFDTPANAPAVLVLSPLEQDFGTVVQGTHSDLGFTITNTGDDVSGTVSVAFSGADAASFTVGSNNCATLAKAATCTIAVEFSPNSEGPKQASLVVASSPGGSVAASLAGTGAQGEGLAIAATTNTSFGTTTIGSTNVTPAVISVINVGAITTGMLVTQLGGADPGEFAIVTDTCMGTMLPPGGTCKVTATFAPSTPGAKSASVTLAANPGGSVSTSLSGTALGPLSLQIVPSPADFGAVSIGLLSATQRFVVTEINGSASGALGEGITGADAADWTIVSSTCVGVSLDPGASCTVDVAFAPTTLGPKAASLTVSGTTTGNATLIGEGTVSEGIIIVAASPFADTNVGQTSAVQTLTVTNPGGVTTGVLSTALVGADPGQFTIVSDHCDGVALAPSGQCTVALVFAPTNATPSTKVAFFTVTGVPGGTVTTGLTGNALAGAVLAIAPPSFDFGDVAAGATAQTTLTVTNTGTASSGVLATTSSGARDFSTLTDTCSGVTLAEGDSCTVTVELAPITVGAKSAAFTIAGGASLTAAVTGNAVANGAFLAITGSEQFADTTVGQASATKTITVSNVGAVATGVLVDALDPTQFTVIADTCAGFVLDAATDCVVVVAFTPTTAGPHTATFELAGSPGGVAATGLSGTALAPPARR